MSNPTLLKAILDNPADDAPRLAYAKWLKANGDPARADFIKVQCDLAAKDRFDPAQERLAKKEKSLLKKNEAKWLAELPEWARRGAIFRRGFVGVLRVGLDEIIPKFAELVKITPVDGVELSSGGADAKSVQALAKCPQAAQLTQLSLWFNEVNNPGVKAIAASPFFANLKTLALGVVGVTDSGVKALAASPHLTGLKTLNLSNAEIGAEGLKALLSSSWKLQSLIIHGTPLGEPGAMAALARWPRLASVVELGIGSCEIGPDAAKELAASPYLTNLKALDVSGNPLAAAGVSALVNAPWATRLIELHLQASELDNAAGLALARAPDLPNLKTLWVVNNNFEDEARQALIARFGKMVQPC